MDSTVHPAWLSVFSGRRHAHQLSSAEEHAADAGERLRGTRAGPGRLWGGDRAALPLLQLRRLHVHHGPPPCPPPRTGEGIVFELLAEEAGARRGRLHTAHGAIDTPAFMPVGTQATVKALTPEEVRELGAQVLLANTYHLALRPGAERIARLGGLHRFMGWDGAILTDSGGFQVFSLDHLVKVSDDGAIFRSHLDGSEQAFTPESVMAIQRQLGSDIAMAFDQPVSWPATAATARVALDRTPRWAARGLPAEAGPGPLH